MALFFDCVLVLIRSVISSSQVVLSLADYCNASSIYDWIYEDCVSTLHQITHIHSDFITLKSLKSLQAMKKEEEKRDGR